MLAILTKLISTPATVIAIITSITLIWQQYRGQREFRITQARQDAELADRKRKEEDEREHEEEERWHDLKREHRQDAVDAAEIIIKNLRDDLLDADRKNDRLQDALDRYENLESECIMLGTSLALLVTAFKTGEKRGARKAVEMANEQTDKNGQGD